MFIMLFVGFLFLISHTNKGEINGFYERELIEPYYSWVVAYSKFYMGSTLILLVLIVSYLKAKKEKMTTKLVCCAVALFSTGLVIDFYIALIKINGIQFVTFFNGILLAALLFQTITVYKKIEWGKIIRNVIWGVVAIMIFYSVIATDSVIGRYVVVIKSDIAGPFISKVIICAIGVVGIGLFLGMSQVMMKEFDK